MQIADARPSEFNASGGLRSRLPANTVTSIIPARMTDGLFPVKTIKNSTKTMPKIPVMRREPKIAPNNENSTRVHTERCIPDTAKMWDAPATRSCREKPDVKDVWLPVISASATGYESDESDSRSLFETI